MMESTLNLFAPRFAATVALTLTTTMIASCTGESSRSAGSSETGAASSRKSTPTTRSAPTTDAADLPAGTKLVAGATIPNSDLVFRRVTTARGEMVWLDSVTQSTGGATRTLRAQLRLPPLAKDERVMLASCDVNGRLDPFVIAIVVNDPGVSRLTKIRQAWRADPRVGRFDILPVAGIVCEDPGSS
jgi:hypothetical protein